MKRGRHGATAAAPARRGSGLHASPVSVITLGLLFLVPVFFTPGQLLEEFEFTKVSLLVTGALLLFGWWVAVESSRLGSGPSRWLGSLPGRAVAAIRRDPLGAAVAAMLLSAVVSTFASVRPPLSVFGAPQSHTGLRTVAALAAMYYASRSLAGNPAWFRRIAQATGAAAAVAVAYSLVQLLRLDPVTWQRQSGFEGLIRSGSTVGHANTLSAYLVTCLPLIVWLAARSRSRAAGIGWTALAAASLFVVVASLSRGAWLGAAAAAATAALLALAAGLRPPRRWVVIGGAALALAILVPLATPMRDAVLTRSGQITDLSAPTSRTRVELWRAGLHMFQDHPLAGVGLDAFVAAFPPYRTASLTQIEWGGTPSKAHNDAIQILATQGVLGGLAALAIVMLCAVVVWRTARRGSPEARAAAIVCASALAGYVASSLVGFGTAATSALAAVLAGWAAHSVQTVNNRATEARTGGGAVRSIGYLVVGYARASVLWFWLVAKPLRAEMYLADALHFPSGSSFRDELLQKAAASAPWDPRYPAELGRSLFFEALREGNAETRLRLIGRSREALTKSIRIAPENSENRILFATTLSAQSVLDPKPNSKQEVREEFRRAVALDPLSPAVLIGAERGLIASGLEGDARELALRCARAYPDYAPPLADLGSMALEQGRTAAAAETLKLAVQRKWRDDLTGAANAWNDLARANLDLGAYPQAADAADSALAHNPNLGQAFAIKEAATKAMSQKGQGGGKSR
jgi:O-antigen ligase/tetratricopeptide (TPR) repeat protein